MGSRDCSRSPNVLIERRHFLNMIDMETGSTYLA